MGGRRFWQHLFVLATRKFILPSYPAWVSPPVAFDLRRKPIYGYRAMVYAVFATGLLGFFVSHHMFMSGPSPMSALVFNADADDRCALSRQDL
jgi:heme/copper-type cytochrome/quinol oxidase subunit 1